MLKLLELDAETMQVVMNGFQPKPGTVNVSGLFMGYVRSLQQTGSKGFQPGVGSTGETPVASVAHNAALQDEAIKFAASWGLDDECLTQLLAQPPQVVADVMAGFRPKTDTRDIRSLFFGYLKSMANGGKGMSQWAPTSTFQHRSSPVAMTSSLPTAQDASGLETEALSFVQHFGLDENCLQQLLQQAPDVARTVMAGFQPKEGTQNICGLFHGYLRSVSTGSKGVSLGKGFKGSVFGAWGKGAPRSAVTRAAPYRPMQPFAGPAKGFAGKGMPVAMAPVTEQELVDFATTWQLDQGCLDFLRTQAQEVQRQVVTRFQPKQGTANVSGLFMSYVNSLARAVPGGKGYV